MGIYQKIKNVKKARHTNIYKYIYNPRFNLIRYMKDYNSDIVNDPLSPKDMEVLRD